MDVVQFVDTISASPTVRLDLNNESPWGTTGVDFSPPPLKQAWSGTLLADGERLSAAAYGNRKLRLSLELIAASQDASAAALQALWRELDRPYNVLKYQPEGATNPVFFRTLRSMDNAVQDFPGGGSLRTVNVEIAAEPFALGLKVTLPQVTVSNDSAEGAALNANPNFETDAANWTAVGGTIARSTAQAHQGVASLLLTPDGVTASAETRSDLTPVTAEQTYRLAAWVRCPVSRTVALAINWYQTGESTFISQSFADAAVTANDWTLIELTATAPALTGVARLVCGLPSTPPVGHTMYIDEARIFQPGTPPALSFDVTSPRGDVETPLFLSIDATDILASSGRRQSLIAVRRRGTPSAAPFAFPAEAMTPGGDTSVQPFQTVMSGPGANFQRCTFAVSAALDTRIVTPTGVPTVPSVDARGTYRAFVRVRKTVSGDVITMRLGSSYNGAVVNGDLVTLPSGTDLRWVDLGLLPLPLGYDPHTDGLSGAPLPVVGGQLRVDAARSSGSGNLDIDALILVPADDRYCEVKWAQFSGPTAFVLDSAANAVYAVGPTGEVQATELLEMEGLPPMVTPGQAARVVFVQDVGTTSSGGDDRTRSTRITPYYWPRYLMVRGVAS